MFLIPLIGVSIGVGIGLLLPFEIPITYKSYTALAILATVDAIFGGMRAQLEENFIFSKFMVSFFANAALAVALAYFCNVLGIDIYMGAVVAFSIRLFNNLSLIREFLIIRYRRRGSK
ncbi:MAG TPA: small basic family protein [Firmicutes bacterium]|jgi:small basic protein|nr:small basic family protein [Bacillota bacterium]